MTHNNRVWVALGSNLGNSTHILQQAWRDLGEDENIQPVILSSPYVTEPVGMDSDNSFLNAVGILETGYSPEQLLLVLQKVEKGFGRVQKTGLCGYQDRLLDLDILYYGSSVINTETLQIPHPHIAKRRFVLAPLVEIDPFHCDPLSGETASLQEERLLQQIADGKEETQEISPGKWS